MPATSASAAVVFDLGNVVIEWDLRRLYGPLIGDEERLEHFLGHIFTLQDNAALDLGDSLQQVTQRAVARNPRYASWIEAFATRWPDTLGPLIPQTVQVIETLAARGVPRYALTNFGAETFALTEARYPFAEWFDGMVVSGRERLAKPDPAIFELLLDRYPLNPAQTVFVDDSPANVQAATALGFDAILFDDPDALPGQLRARGLL